jgi:hypothetical protein
MAKGCAAFDFPSSTLRQSGFRAQNIGRFHVGSEIEVAITSHRSRLCSCQSFLVVLRDDTDRKRHQLRR